MFFQQLGKKRKSRAKFGIARVNKKTKSAGLTIANHWDISGEMDV